MGTFNLEAPLEGIDGDQHLGAWVKPETRKDITMCARLEMLRGRCEIEKNIYFLFFFRWRKLMRIFWKPWDHVGWITELLDGNN